MPADIAVHIEAVARRPNRAHAARYQWPCASHEKMAVEVNAEHRGAWFIAQIGARRNEVAA